MGGYSQAKLITNEYSVMIKRIRVSLNKSIKGERGQALVLVLIMLLLGGLIIAPLLAYMGTGIKTGLVFEKKTDELYAADAGVEDAVWKIMSEVASLPSEENPTPLTYTVADMNSKDAGVTVTYEGKDSEGGDVYLITSTADETEIKSYVVLSGGFGMILDSVITSQADYTLQGPTSVTPGEGEEHGPVANYNGDWPTPEELAAFYWQDVEDEVPYASGTLDVKDWAATGIGPLYRDGTLSIQNTGASGLTLQLNGTVYITGDTLIGTTNHDFTINLNGNTIFVESATIGSPYALEIGNKCTITGSGCIIAVGDIQFKPNLNASPGDYVLVMSVTGMTYMQPNGDFYGTLAGSSEVQIQNGDAYWTDPSDVEGGLNFPGGGGGGSSGRSLKIHTWGIS